MKKKERLSDRFVRELQFRNYSPRTVSTYLTMLIQLSKYFSCSPDQLSADQIKEYLFYCKEKRDLSNSYINQTISALKILKRDVLGQPWNEGIKINRPRRNQHLPAILSKQEISAMMEVTWIHPVEPLIVFKRFL